MTTMTSSVTSSPSSDVTLPRVRISVLLPVKNGDAYLGEAIDSVRAQTFADWRLLVLDHGSTDRSRVIAEAFAANDARIVVHCLPTAVGLPGLLNAGLDLCDSEFVMRHDADDVCCADRMAVMLAAFAADLNSIAIGGQAMMIDAAGAALGEVRVPVGARAVSAAALFCNPVIHPAAMFRLAPLRVLGARYGIDFLRVLPAGDSITVDALAEDYLLFGQLALLGKCSNIDHPVIRYRWHGDNISSKRAVPQQRLTLAIARFLARSLAAMHATEGFDPVPFCNHGGTLVDFHAPVDFGGAYQLMCGALTTALGESAELRRQLDFRHVVATRNVVSMLWRYLQFCRCHTIEPSERNAIRSWLIHRLTGRGRHYASPLVSYAAR